MNYMHTRPLRSVASFWMGRTRGAKHTSWLHSTRSRETARVALCYFERKYFVSREKDQRDIFLKLRRYLAYVSRPNTDQSQHNRTGSTSENKKLNLNAVGNRATASTMTKITAWLLARLSTSDWQTSSGWINLKLRTHRTRSRTLGDENNDAAGEQRTRLDGPMNACAIGCACVRDIVREWDQCTVSNLWMGAGEEGNWAYAGTHVRPHTDRV